MRQLSGRTRGFREKYTSHILAHAFLISCVLVVLFPVSYVILSSFRPGNILVGELIPKHITFEHWKYVLGMPYVDTSTNEIHQPEFPIFLWLWNSVKISGITAFLMIILSTTGAYALARLKFKGRRSVLLTLIFLQLFPSVMSMVALYLMLNFIGQYIPWLGLNTHGGLTMTYLGGVPFNMWLMKGYFETLPADLEEAALIDGCTRWQTFVRVLLPLSVPIVAVVGVLVFIGTFSDFLLPSIVIRDMDKMTFAVGLKTIGSSSFGTRWGVFSAASIMGGLPIAVIFLLAQRYLVSGLASGGVKG